MNTLTIGKGVELPVSFVTSKCAILAMTGAGKTYLAKAIAEEMLEHGIQIAVADYTGVWYGLTSSADGKRPGHNVVVFGGDHGDVPLREEMGTLIADATVKERISPILDLSGFEHDAPKIRLMTDFARRLYHANKRPIHFFVDEADEFVPQHPQREQIAMFAAIKRIWQRGRVKGIGGTLISQRSASINKTLLAQSEALIALRSVSPQDRNALAAWFEAWGTEEQIKEFNRTIASLEKHHAWFWSPAHDLFVVSKARKLKTFDSGATPDASIDIVEPKARTEHNIERLNKVFADLKAEAKSNDPIVLRKQLTHFEEQFKQAKGRVEQLEKRLANKSEIAPKTKPVRVPLLTKAQEKMIRVAIRELGKVRIDIDAMLRQAATAIAEDVDPAVKALLGALERVGRHVAGKPAEYAVELKQDPPFELPRPVWPSTVPHVAPQSTNGDGGGGKVGSGERRILAALRQFGTAGQLPYGRARVLAGILKAATFSTYVGRLKKAGHVSADGSTLTLTDAGALEVKDVRDLPTGADLANYWRSEFGQGGERRIFDALIHLADTKDLYMIDRATLMERAQINNEASFSTYIGRLKIRGILQVNGGQIGLDDAFKQSLFNDAYHAMV